MLFTTSQDNESNKGVLNGSDVTAPRILHVVVRVAAACIHACIHWGAMNACLTGLSLYQLGYLGREGAARLCLIVLPL